LRREGAELLVLLSHLGLSADRKLAEPVPEIDVIVGGHSHNRMKQLLRVGQTIIVQSGAHLSDLGRLDIEIEDGKVISARSELIALDNALLPSTPEIASKIEQYNKGAADAEIAVAETPIVRAQTLAGSDPRKRDQESHADSLFADIVREHARVEIAFLPGVGYGVAIPAGLVRKSALRNLVPHDSRLTTMTLTGTDIKDILEQSVENVLTEDPEKKVGGIIQVSGLSFTYRSDQKIGSRVQTVLVDGKPLNPQQQYQVATNSMLAAGSHDYRSFTRGADRHELAQQYDVIEGAFRKRERIVTPESGRIKAATQPTVTK
jgi:2',3'-cyclic-nucleotide 2'-phosphodiesterase (5'-nucleotidase family)